MPTCCFLFADHQDQIKSRHVSWTSLQAKQQLLSIGYTLPPGGSRNWHDRFKMKKIMVKRLGYRISDTFHLPCHLTTTREAICMQPILATHLCWIVKDRRCLPCERTDAPCVQTFAISYSPDDGHSCQNPATNSVLLLAAGGGKIVQRRVYSCAASEYTGRMQQESGSGLGIGNHAHHQRWNILRCLHVANIVPQFDLALHLLVDKF